MMILTEENAAVYIRPGRKAWFLHSFKIMRLMNIASGSSGNATYVGNDNTHILIDAGVSRKRIIEGLRRLDLTLKDLSAILVTHEHSDHISSLNMLERAVPVPIYATEGTIHALREKDILPQDLSLVQRVRGFDTFMIGEICITVLPVSHDAAEPVCFKMTDPDASCAVVTDLGEYDDRLFRELTGLSAVLLEANHDIRMLETGPYPYPLKRRIAGNRGHLSNEASGQLLSRLLHDDMKQVVLGHLSQKNNYPELAKLAVEQEIEAWDNPYHALDFPIDVADPLAGTAVYCL